MQNVIKDGIRLGSHNERTCKGITGEGRKCYRRGKEIYNGKQEVFRLL